MTKTYNSNDLNCVQVRYLACATCTPGVMVLLTVAWQQTAHSHSGYGGPACYITRPEARLLALLVPLLASVAANVTMFVFTLVRLRRAMQRAGEERVRYIKVK